MKFLQTAPEPDHSVRCPPTPQMAIAIKNLRMIADDIEQGCDCFKCFLQYDFSHIVEDVEAGKTKRNQH